MAKKFFDSWQLWEKMCFVLALGILAVIGLGCMKLVYNHWRLRKYTAIAAAKASQKQEMQHSASVRRRKGPEVPFGIRAIESGIEVDGVWISRGNTPAPSLPDTPLASPSPGLGPAPDRTSSGSVISRLEIPQPAHGYPGGVGPRPGSGSGLRNSPFERVRPGSAAGSPFERVRPGSAAGLQFERGRPGSAAGVRNSPFERVRPGSAAGVLNAPFERGFSPESSSTRPSSMASDHGPRGRPTYQPRHSSHLRFSNSQNPENSAAMAALEGRLLNQKRNGSDDLSDHPKDQSAAGSWSVSSSNESTYANQKTPEVDLKPDHSVATSQFNTPTSQTAAVSNENSPSFSASQNSSDSRQSQTVPQIRLSGVDHDWTAGAPPAEDKYLSSALHENKDPFGTSDHLTEARTGPNHVNETPGSDPPKRRFSLSDDEIEPVPATTRLVQNGGDSRHGPTQVIRKVNSGFEILLPGSLNRPRNNNETNSGQELEAGGSSHGRKLLKKNRDSASLRESRFTEGA